jgi:hypothetical protein
VSCGAGGAILVAVLPLVLPLYCQADIFKERLGLVLEREDEIGCAVGGCNFLLRTITHEAFAFEAGQAQFVPCCELYCLMPVFNCSRCFLPCVLLGQGPFYGVCFLLVERPLPQEYPSIAV